MFDIRSPEDMIHESFVQMRRTVAETRDAVDAAILRQKYVTDMCAVYRPFLTIIAANRDAKQFCETCPSAAYVTAMNQFIAHAELRHKCIITATMGVNIVIVKWDNNAAVIEAIHTAIMEDFLR